MDTAGKQKKPSHKQTNEDGDEQQMNKKNKSDIHFANENLTRMSFVL